jgi:hypothetical protein
MIGNQSVDRFAKATLNNGMLDYKLFFKETMLTHLGNQWPINPFPKFYKKLFND